MERCMEMDNKWMGFGAHGHAHRIFGGEAGPYRDIVVLNAAAGLVTAGIAEDLGDGCERSGAAIDSGAAAARLSQLVELSQRLAG